MKAIATRLFFEMTPELCSNGRDMTRYLSRPIAAKLYADAVPKQTNKEFHSFVAATLSGHSGSCMIRTISNGITRTAWRMSAVINDRKNKFALVRIPTLEKKAAKIKQSPRTVTVIVNVTTSTPAAVKTSLLTLVEFGGTEKDEFAIVPRLFPRWERHMTDRAATSSNVAYA